MTLLESYYTYWAHFDRGIQESKNCQTLVWMQQEVLYRIEVLEVCKMFAKTAPNSAKPEDLYWHFQMVDAYFQSLMTERRYSVGIGEEARKQRDTAYGNLSAVIEDYRRSFQNFTPGDDTGYYAKTIKKIIQTVLATWIAYRQAFTEITEEAA